MRKINFVNQGRSLMGNIIGISAIVGLVFFASSIDFEDLFANSTKTSQNLLNKPAPSFGEGIWLNGKPLTLQGLKGKVVLVDFWTYSCINCKRTFPFIQQWHNKYKNRGLVIVGVHSQEFAFEEKQENVAAAIKQYGITYPVLVDNNLQTWNNYNNQFWPAHYLINQKGEIVYQHFGEGNYLETENQIRKLLGMPPLKNEETENEDAVVANISQTPETYLGYRRAEKFASSATINQKHDYEYPQNLEQDHWALNGTWQILDEKIVTKKANASLKLKFKASKVFLVLGKQQEGTLTQSKYQNNQEFQLKVKLNNNEPKEFSGKDLKDGKLTINMHNLYEIIDQKEPKEGTLEIIANKPGVELYAFTFG